MAFYVDNQDGTDANNGTSPNTPVRTWNAANIGGGTFAPGAEILFAGGKLYSQSARFQYGLSGTPTAALPVRFGSYGNGKAIIDGNGTINAMFYGPDLQAANPGRHLIYENLQIQNSGGVCIFMWDSTDSVSVTANNIVRNCTILNSGGVDKPAIQSWGRGTIFEDNYITDSAWDSLHIQGQANIARRNTILRPGRTTSIGGDDCIQMLGASDDCIIEYNYLDKSGYGVWKQALVAKGDRTIVRFNTIHGPSDGAGNLTADGGSGMLIYGNYVSGNDGIYLLNATGAHTVVGNVVVGTNPNLTQAESTGIDHFSSPLRNHLIQHNLVVNHRRGIYAEGATVRNNIVRGCVGTGIDTGAGATLESHNLSFGNGANFSGTPGTGSIQVDPLLLSLTQPWLGLRSDSPCWNAGTFITGSYDWNGKEMQPSAPPIGPFQQYGARSNASSRSVGSRSLADRDLAYRLGIAA